MTEQPNVTEGYEPAKAGQVNDLKQACLDLSAAAGELFDRFDEHGLEAAWKGDGVLVVMRMQNAHEKVRSFLSRQAAQRMIALGVSPETLARFDHVAAHNERRQA